MVLLNTALIKLAVLLSLALTLAPIAASQEPSTQSQGQGKRLDLVFRIEDIGGQAQELQVKETGAEIRIDLEADVLFDFDKAEILPKAAAACSDRAFDFIRLASLTMVGAVQTERFD